MIVERPAILKNFKMPTKKTAIKLGLVFLVLAVVCVGVSGVFQGDKKVEFTVLGDKEIPGEITSQVIPEYRQLERALACVVGDKIYVLASRGEKPTTGYELQIEKLSVNEKNGKTTLTVYTKFKDPQPGTSLTQTASYPIQVAETNLTKLPDQIELKVQYVE